MEEAINNEEAISDYFIVSTHGDENVTQTDENLDNNLSNKTEEGSEPVEEEHLSGLRITQDDGKDHQTTENVDNDTPQISVTKVLSATQIDEMFHFNQSKGDEEGNEKEDEEPFDLNPQVNIEDMKVALDELREVDVLVCGSCHNVVHFVEEFMKHKPVCKKKSDFHGNIAETKPQVWAFLLWKNAQAKINKRGTHIEESSWKLYQKWCKMPERIRNAWVAAGQTVMNFSTFGYAKPVDTVIKPLPTKKSTDKEDFDEGEEEKPVIMRKLVQRDSSGEIKEIKSTTGVKKRMEDIENIRNQLEDGDSSQDNKEVMMGKDGEQDTLQEEEFVVEKIVSRRFNPRRKQYEYLLKWEGYPSEQNTWEPAENLEACQHLLKAFEENLAKQSLNKQKTAISRKVENNQTSNAGNFSYGGRPIRYSKQKALNQVKAWCGSIKPDDAELEMLKRRMPITDSDEDEDPFAKKLKLERETDSEDSMGGRVVYSKSGKSGIIRRPGRPPLKPKITNGTTESLAAVLGLESSGDESKSSAALDAINRGIVKKSTGLSPHNQQVLVANAKGVVKVDPSQVPNLSSGVYIMSNKSGIIKLDSVSPSKALSLKGASPGSVKQLAVQQNASATSAASTISTNSGTVTSTTQSGVIMVNRENQGLTKSGVMRRPGITRGRGVGRPPGRPPNSSFRVSNPNTRLIHSGSRSNIAITPAIRPKLPLRPGVTTSSSELQRRMDGERKVLGPKVGRGASAGGRGSMRGRGGGRGGYMSVSSDKKDLDTDNVFIDLPQESSSDSDAGLPDLFPTDLPPLEPASPPRPLTLCPETGKVLLKAEGEKTPEPTPPHSPKQNSHETSAPSMPTIKEEPSGNSSFLNKLNSSSSGKETLVKKTLKPGTIGSLSVSPKKSFDENDSDVVTITGDDGLVYKVRKSELNNTLLVSGEDGQQCVYVATGEEGEENATVLTLDPSYADTVAQLSQVNILGGDGDGETQFYVKEGEEGELVSLQVQGGGSQDGSGEETQSQVVAQLVEAGEPAPGGGPRRVVLLLPDGNLMMTEVDEEQYAALELDKFQTGGDME
ncbi:uncharacterized protein Chro isoform X2 [Halyomorpha halys]|uniref:uncharacterized protein Chro isoform X2 n=1 Tax=Halyomorpha halys TaxID=286706 RepID=UPI0006D4E800|nr:uncharacterized protein LOC106692848 isoform X2 [Halyomorpha halys]